MLASVSDAGLLAELNRRAAATRDERCGFSRQICPSCSTPEREILGTWERATSRFECDSCGAVLRGNGYEERLEAYYRKRWRARKARRDLAAAAHQLARGRP